MLSCHCDKAPWPRGLGLQRGGVHDGGAEAAAVVVATSWELTSWEHKQEAEKANLECHVTLTIKSNPRETLPPARPHLLNYPKQHAEPISNTVIPTTTVIHYLLEGLHLWTHSCMTLKGSYNSRWGQREHGEWECSRAHGTQLGGLTLSTLLQHWCMWLLSWAPHLWYFKFPRVWYLGRVKYSKVSTLKIWMWARWLNRLMHLPPSPITWIRFQGSV